MWSDHQRRPVPETTQWRQIWNFPNYWVSDSNLIFNMRRGHLMKTYFDQDGVLITQLWKEKRSRKLSVVKLRMIAFKEGEYIDGYPVLKRTTRRAQTQS